MKTSMPSTSGDPCPLNSLLPGKAFQLNSNYYLFTESVGSCQVVRLSDGVVVRLKPSTEVVPLGSLLLYS